MAAPISSAGQSPAGASPEWKLLVACARTRLREQDRERIREVLRQPVDWARFISNASQHRLQALVSRNLSIPEIELPRSVRLSIPMLAKSRSRESLQHAGELIKLMDLFESGKINAVPYKGPTLGALAYGNFALRSFMDLDFILPQEDLLRAAALLKSQGFRAYPDPTQEEEARLLSWFPPGQYAFSCDSKLLHVELHTEKTLRYIPVPLDWSGLASRLTEVSFGGRRVRTFSVEDTLILLSVHGTKHFWERLSWICDIAELVQCSPGVDWHLGEALASRAGCRRMWLLALSLANRVLDAPLPAHVYEWIESDPQVAWLRQRIESTLAREDQKARGVPARLAFRLRSHESLPVGLRQSLRTALSPTEEDWKGSRLPAWAAPVYWAVRPWRVLCEHGVGLRRPGKKPDLAEFVPTPHESVERVLRFAALKTGDVLYDLGCGDGRIVIAAAREFGIRAVGIDIDPECIAEARANARQSGVEHLVEFRQQDALSTDVSPATVVTLYLSDSGTVALSERLQQRLRPGARVISRDTAIPGWHPCNTQQIRSSGSEHTSTLFEWRIPERVENLPKDIVTTSVGGC
jgi:Uncharacterised nucleotidyltransferase/Methyltransferase domain